MTETSPSSRRSRGCTPKRVRTPEEVEALSRTFSADWRPGDHVMTWLKRHEGKTQELSNLVRDGWSWTDVGRAMAVAGIHYRSGEAMSAPILRKKASEARAAIRDRQAVDAGSSQGKATIKASANPGSGLVDIEFWNALRSKQVAGQVAQAVVARTGSAKGEEPEFRPVRLRKYEPSTTSQLVEEEGDAEIIAGVFGVPVPTRGEEPEFRPASLKGSGTNIPRQADKLPETKPAPAQSATIDAQAVIDRLLGKLPPTLPATAAPASPFSKAASLVLAGTRILEQTRAALRNEPRAPETAEEQTARIDRLLSQGGPKAPRRRFAKR